MTPDKQLFTDVSVFILEDETLVLFNLEDILAELGCRVVGPAMRLDQAEALLAEASEADAAILDVNIGGNPVFPLAARLKEAGVPLIFATGYGAAGLPAEWQGSPVLQKPYTSEEVTAALLALLATA